MSKHWLISVVLTAGLGSFLAAATGCSQGGSAYATPDITRAQAVTYAESVNLHAGDIKGFKVESANGYSQTRRTTLGSCGMENSKYNEIAKIDSPTLTSALHKKNAAAFDSVEQASSSVNVMENSLVASRELKLFAAMARESKTTDCLARSLERLRLEVVEGGKLAGRKFGQPLFSHVRVSEAYFPQNSTLGGIVGLRIAANSWLLRDNPRGASNYFVEIFKLSAGPATVTVSYAGSPRPVPAMIQRRSLLLVFRRAKTVRL